MYKTLPWFDDFKIIPKSIHNEFANALIENSKFHEINLAAILLSNHYEKKFKLQYLEYLVYMKEQGVKFSIGSDCHDENYAIDFKKANNLLKKYSLNNEFKLI